jgi:hypothetical protein
MKSLCSERRRYQKAHMSNEKTDFIHVCMSVCDFLEKRLSLKMKPLGNYKCHSNQQASEKMNIEKKNCKSKSKAQKSLIFGNYIKCESFFFAAELM